MWPFTTPYPELRIDQLFDEYDYIIVGGGTAGCVLANRLSAPASEAGPERLASPRVLLVERGPVADSWASRVPLLSCDFASHGSWGLARPMRSQAALDGRSMEAYSGAVLGGTSKINGMLYMRGLPAEYDRWEAEGGVKGWGWDAMQKCFLKSEKADVEVEGVHSTKGLWKTRTHADFYFRASAEVLEAAKELGLPYIPDINSPSHPPFGCARLDVTIDENAHRHSTDRAFLPKKLALERMRAGQLHICTGTIVERLVTERTAEGELVVTGVVVGPTVEGKHRSKPRTIRVRKEVVLSAGPFGSPQILMLSGIGPAEHLKELGITIMKDLPAVGSNLQDHFGVTVEYNVRMWDSLHSLQKWPWRILIELVRYLIWGTGLMLLPIMQVAIFTHSKVLDDRGLPIKTERAFEEKLPDIEIMPMTCQSGDYAVGRLPKPSVNFSLISTLLAPQSRGTVRLSSPDPRSPLVIDPAYLSNPADIAPLRASLKLSLRLRDRMRARGYMIQDALVPKSENDEDLDAWIRVYNRTTYHYSSTCRMGRLDDEKWDGGAVVDEQLKVYGVRRLRVADSSVFPWIPRTHTQVPAVAVAERCAEMILSQES